jgi:two-component system chemotaxis response regulator CheY
MARILVVDDAMFIRKLVSEYLRDEGHTVVGEACNGVEAVQLYKELNPDVTTLDITMPEQDGLDALRAIMAHDANARVLMCSALKERGKVMEALEIGARDYVLKPIKRARVIEAVEKTLAA